MTERTTEDVDTLADAEIAQAELSSIAAAFVKLVAALEPIRTLEGKRRILNAAAVMLGVDEP